MEDQIEIEEDALREFLEDKDFRGRVRFKEWQIKFILDHPNIIKDLLLDRDFRTLLIRFDMFQIRYLLKLFSI